MSRAEATRRVGASGRRMPRHLLPALALSLLLLCGACGPAFALSDAAAGSVPLFVPGLTKVPANVGDPVPTKDVGFFRSPFLVGGSGVMLALAEAGYAGSDEKSIGIVARYIETGERNWASKATEENEDNWKTQLALPGTEGVNHSVLRNPTAVIKGDKTYLLALRNRTNNSSQNGNGWHFELAVGEIKGEVGNKKIEWGSSKSLHSKLMREINRKKLKLFSGYAPSAFLTSKGRILFGANATNKEGKWGYAILHLENEEQWRVSFAEKPEECRHFSLFEWKEKLFSMFTGCTTGSSHMREYDEVEEEWNGVDNTLFYLFNSKATSTDVTNVTNVIIGNKTVLLFTGNQRPTDEGTRAIPLRFTDGLRAGVAGWINTQYATVTSGGLVYTNDELFFIYQGTDKGSGKIVVQRLDEQLETIKSKLNTWAEKDAYLSKPCNETAPGGASADTLCVTPMPTDGLVSFLSDKGDATRWYDEYNFVNAQLRGGTRVKNGYTFRDAYSGAWWPVGGWYEDKRYNFDKYGMTVVATVTIHEIPKSDSPLLTVERFASFNRLGLWYKNPQWKVVSANGEEEPAVDFEIQKEYRVALTMQNNTISAYVNGKSLGSPAPLSQPNEEPFVIKNAHIGWHAGGSGINMTVTNVLLYNRVLNDTELEAASERVPPPAPTEPKETPTAPTEPKEKPATPTESNKTLGTSMELKEPPGAPTEPNKTPTAPTEPNKTPGTSTDPKETPAMPTEPNKTLGTSMELKEPPGAPTESKEKPPAPTELKETPPAPTESKETPRTPTEPNKTPGTSTDPKETPRTPTEPNKTPGTSTDPKETPRTPTNSEEDSCVCVRMCLTSWILLGGFCLAIFW